MNEEIKEYIEKIPSEICGLFLALRDLLYNNVSTNIEEKMWAKLPTYYVGESFVRLIPFKDHINIEATSIMNYKEELKSFKITPKGMLQIYANQEIPSAILKQIFVETL